MSVTKVDICVCTYRRDSIVQTLKSLLAQILPPETEVSIIVADNDETPTAARLIADIADKAAWPVRYIHAPMRNISIARNACLEAATGDYLAFIDDDEIAAPDWISQLLHEVRKGNYTAVFGPSHARYEADTPLWIREKEYHSNYPERRHGHVETGHTCNVLINRTDPVLADERFLLEKGRTGGEDTEFFFRLGHKGGRFAINNDAKVFEEVPPARLNFRWLARRKFRYGLSYGFHAAGGNKKERLRITLLALVKSVFSFFAAVAYFWSALERNYWLLRAIFHAGVVASYLGLSEQELY